MKRFAWLACMASVVVLVSYVATSAASNGQGSGSLADPTQAHVSLADQPAAVTGTCFWGVPGGPLDGVNVLAPETNVGYWYDRFQLPAGAHIVLHGEFPHARFMSLTSYGTVEGQPGSALGGLSDYQIDPDPGSTNPFRDGTMRTAPHRSFTVTLSGQADPGQGNRAPNTFYVGQAGHTDETQTVELILRIYRPDKNRDMAGGVPLPVPTLVLADGTQLTGLAACDGVKSVTGLDQIPLTGISVPVSTYLQLLSLPGAGPTHPAVDPILWYRQFNQPRLLEPFYAGTEDAYKIAGLPSAIIPALYPTPANAYVYAYADRTFGPDPNGHNILVLHAKLPTHPRTFSGDPRNDYAGKQVRYWSLCNYGAIANPPISPVNSDCLFDEEIPTDAHGYYTIVVSLAQDRPSNAIPRCGVAWLDWTTIGDGIPGGHDRLITLNLRNQSSAPWFAQATDKILTPGTEQQVMGDYYPHGTYTTKAQFEGLGCKYHARHRKRRRGQAPASSVGTRARVSPYENLLPPTPLRTR